MRYYFEKHFFIKQHKSRKAKSDFRSRIIYMKRNETAIFFIQREEREQMSLRPTSGSKSPRRKISSRAYFWKCQGDASPWRSRQPRGWCHTTIPRDNPGYPEEGARVPCTFRLFSSLYVYICIIRVYIVVSYHTYASIQKSVARPGTSERPRRRLYDGCVGFDVT